MSEPAAKEVPQPTTEMVEENVAEQPQVSDGNEENQSQPQQQEEEEELETEIQPDKEDAAPDPEEQEVEQHPETEESESQSQEEQQQQSQEEPEKAMDDSQDAVQMAFPDSSQRAIEDEEMPSMVTNSYTSRIDESETYNKQDEESKFVDVGGISSKQTVSQEKDSDSDSVCVIDDDDDDEEEPNDYDDEEDDRNTGRRARPDDQEGESSFEDDYDGSSSYDSEEMDEEHYNDKYGRRYQENVRRPVEEDVDDEDDGEEDEDEYMDDQDFGGGGSDDAVLRPNSNGLARQQKERSSSLQDLSLIQDSQPKNRHNVNPFSQKAIFERNQGKRKPYAHVESKVKKYIDDLDEQRRISHEMRRKSNDEVQSRHDKPTEIQIQRSEEVMMACQAMKNYTEKTLKEVAESEENEKMMFLQQGVENGEISLIPRQIASSQNVIVSKTHEMEIDLVEEDDEKRPTLNGATVPKENQITFVSERRGILRRENGPPKSSILNGEDPLCLQPIDNLRTLTYDEYMKGSASEANEVVLSRIDVSEVQSIPLQNAEMEDDSGLRIESVVSNYSSEKATDDFQNRKTPPVMVNQSTETFYRENPEMQNLRLQLSQRNQQFEVLREAYQKTMSDNLTMKMELENLRKEVAYYQGQQKSPKVETKALAIQTEVPASSRDMPLLDLEANDPKLGVSVVSTQWSDTTGSVTQISVDPPNVTTALNSDESAQQPKTPVTKRNALSRAFMTSTKILQTLSSITYGRTKVDKLGKPPKVNEAEKSTKVAPPNSKKRKASDTMDDSSQPTKIPHLSKSTDQAEGAPTTPEPQFVNPNTKEQEGTAGTSTEKKSDERDREESTSDEDVKVYVYPEDEDGREHSFLIQAKEVSSNPKPGVRECGPYLLGNVEVYMTEVNGTINIWGKELSQTSQTTTEDLDASTRSKDLRQNLRWQSTPRIFNKHEGGSASTSKKSRLLPSYAQSHQDSQCEHNQRLSWPSSCHDQHQHQQHHHQHQHSCCSTPTVRVESACGCVHEQKRTPGCCKAKSMPNMNQNCCCSALKPLARRHSFNPTDEEDSDEDDDVNRTLLFDNCSSAHSHSKSKMQRSAEQRRSAGGSSNEPSTILCENDSDPLIAARQAQEGFEVPEKKRKKKVRGLLMDLLKKGCVGDCRTANPNLHHTTSIYEPTTSAQHRASCLPSQPSCSQPANERCSSCCNKTDKTSQLESQMERFREEMDKLRSQSETLAGMMQALKNADIIN